MYRRCSHRCLLLEEVGGAPPPGGAGVAPGGSEGSHREAGTDSDLLGSPMGEPGALPPGEEREEMGEREVPEMVFSLHRLGEKWGKR